MNPTKTLPETYTLAWSLNMKKDRRLNWALQVVGLFWFFIAGFLLLKIVAVLRPDFQLLGLLDVRGILLWAGEVLLIIFVTVTIHELVHGVFFWLFTKARPQFGIGPGYAYAAAPDWYFPKRKYLVIGLAPLVVLTVFGLIAIMLAPMVWTHVLFMAVAFNAGGAISDMYVCTRIGFKSPNILVKDTGDGFEIYSVSG